MPCARTGELNDESSATTWWFAAVLFTHRTLWPALIEIEAGVNPLRVIQTVLGGIMATDARRDGWIAPRYANVPPAEKPCE